MKRLISLCLTAILCLSLMVSAGAEGSGIVYEGKPFAPITSEPVTLSVLTYASGTNKIDYDAMTWFHEALKETNITLNMELSISGMYNELMSTRLAAGVDLPDIIRVSDNDGTYANSGLFIPLNDLTEKYGFNYKKKSEQYPAGKGSLVMYDGTQYYMPFYFLASEHCRNLCYNVKLFEENGLAVPTTTDELYETLKAIKALGDWNGNGQDDEIPLQMYNSNLVNIMGAFWGLDIVNSGFSPNEEGIVECDYVKDEYKDFLLYVRKLIEEGLMNEDFSSSTWDLENALWTNNCIAVDGAWVSNIGRFEAELDPSYNYLTDDPVIRVLPPLEGPFGDKKYMGRPPVGPTFAITRDCTNPEAAYCLLDYMLNDEVNDMTWMGIEGIDYTKDEEGNISFTDVYLANENDYRFTNGYNSEMLTGSQSLFGYGLATNNPQNVAQWAENAEYTELPISFAYLPDEYNEILNTYSADFTTYVSESYTAFLLGTRDIESEWDSYVAACNGLGLEELTKVYQARYDASK